MEQYTIKDLENLSGIKAHTLRIWEQRYNIIKPQRTNTNIRYYNASQLKKLLNVSLLNKNGLKISLIDKLTDEEINHKLQSFSSANLQQEKLINELVQFMIDMDGESFENTLGVTIASIGFEKTMLTIIYPYLEKIGLLWQTNHINPAQEHIISNIIRQKIILATAHLPQISNAKESALLFLPEGEYHEIALLFLQYLLKRNNVKVFYLGSSMPADDVLEAAKLLVPNYLFTHVTVSNSKLPLNGLCQYLLKQNSKIQLLVSGLQASLYNKKIPTRLTLFKSFAEVLNFVKQL